VIAMKEATRKEIKKAIKEINSKHKEDMKRRI
jgi:hypothetical protein